MLTSAQEQWLAHLSDTETVAYFPFDPAVLDKFTALAVRVRGVLGTESPVELRGSAALGIGGQREIDVYVPVPPTHFAATVTSLQPEFGQPGSLYPLERARFAWHEGDVKIELFVINEDGDGWKNAMIFESHLASHPSELARYGLLKRVADGASVREYYRRKLEFMNEILAAARGL